MRTELVLAAAATLLLPGAAAASSCVPGFDFAMFAKETLQIQGNAGTDSYDSSAGTYTATKTCGDADFGTNATTRGAVVIQGNSTEICGDGVVGAGGSPAQVIAGNGNIVGTRRAQGTNLALPDVTVPSLPSAATPNPSTSNKHTTLAPDRTYGTISCKNGSLTLLAGTYVVQSIALTANCELRLGGGRVEVYFTSALQLQGGTVVNATQVPGNLVFYGGPAATAVQVQGGVDASFAVYAPSASCQLQGNADVWGALVCETGQIQGNAHIHYDRALRELAGGGFRCPATEVSRATPVVATVEGTPAIVQGTYERPTGTRTAIASPADLATFTFPHVRGHVRARTTASIDTTGSSFAAGTVHFDAAAHIPPPSMSGCTTFTGSCRNVFTVTALPDADGTARRPPMVPLRASTAATVGALIAPAAAVPGITTADWTTLVRTVLAAPLGGVDRSTVAVIPASAVAGVASRPTIVYVGATDGMLHAICASVGGTTPSQANICPRLGAELWAFLPRVQLPLVRTNTARIDGSPRVVDAFGDFDGDGRNSFRTVLTFQTGTADGAAIYALDVTDPAAPRVLWEHAPPDLGPGLALAAGPTLVGARTANLVVAATADRTQPGLVATALDLATGARAWQFTAPYPSPPRGIAADRPLPETGIPGGAVGVDLAGHGFTTDVVIGDLYGRLWRLDAATGASRTGEPPLFSFSTNKHPIGAVPAIYGDGNQHYAVVASGGYADPIAAHWHAGTQRLIAVSLTAPGPYPLDERSAALAVNEELPAGADGFAQVRVIGQELFVSTDVSDVNATGFGAEGDTGRLVRYDLASGAATTVVIRGGAGAIAHVGTELFGSSSDRQQRVDTGAASTVGTRIDTTAVARLRRQLWLRTQ